jgi:hypothetical protein
MYAGISSIENISSKSILRYFIVALLIVIIFYLSISWISRSVLEGMYFAFAGSI